MKSILKVSAMLGLLWGCGDEKSAKKAPDASAAQPIEVEGGSDFPGTLHERDFSISQKGSDFDLKIKGSSYLKVDPKWVHFYEKTENSTILSLKEGAEKQYITDLSISGTNVDYFRRQVKVCGAKNVKGVITSDVSNCSRLTSLWPGKTKSILKGAAEVTNLSQSNNMLQLRLVTRDSDGASQIYFVFSGTESLVHR